MSRAGSGSARWRWQRPALNVLAVLIAVGAWHAAAVWKDNLLVFPTPLTSLSALRDVLSDSEQRGQLLITLRRVVIGFALGSALGVAVGSLIGSVRSVALTLEPIVHFLRSVTPVAWIVPATIWLGVGEGSLRFIVVYATVFPVIINTLAGLSQVPVNKVRMARTFGASRLRIHRSIIVPCAVPYIVTGMRLALGYSFMSVVAAEMVAGRDGIGFLIYDSRVFFDTPTMFAGILLLGAAGLLFDKVFGVAVRRGLGRFYAGQVNP